MQISSRNSLTYFLKVNYPQEKGFSSRSFHLSDMSTQKRKPSALYIRDAVAKIESIRISLNLLT